MTITILQHDAAEGPGIIADWALARGHRLAPVHLYRGDSLPVAAEALVVMGGPMNIYQDRDYPWLRAERMTPGVADWSADAGRTWPEVVAAHRDLLTDPELRAAYFAAEDPLAAYGLPMAPVADMGHVLVLRAQRAVLRKWLVDLPWARAGEVTVANSGDLAKEAGLLPAEALVPQSR